MKAGDPTSIDFSLAALYAAIEAARQARKLSWAETMREIAPPSGPAGGRIASSTATRLRTARTAEADGVLQMLRWLQRSPESFIPGHRFDEAAAALPAAPPGRILRFDTRALYEAVDAQRRAGEMTWTKAAAGVGVPAAGLAHLARGGRTAFPQVMRIVRWVRRPAADFVRVSSR